MYVLSLPNPNFQVEGEVTASQENLFRPGAQEFISSLAQSWEIIFFSSRKQDQLDRLVNVLDPLKVLVRFVLDRRHCSITSQRKCVKDLSYIMNFNRQNSIIIDYKPQNVAFSLEAALIVEHWDGSAEDGELVGLQKHLEFLASQPDAVQVNSNRNSYSQLLSQIYKQPTTLEDRRPK
jgi:TFIIF-interacting CTD phosphatase-like protein